MQVLLIHDSQAVRSIFRRYFAAEFGEDKLYCVTSAEALAALGAQTFDLIFSGIEMMFMDGFEIHRSILSTPNADTPFVALSSNRSSKQLQKFAAHNIKTYLLTPFSPMALRQMIITCYNPQLRRSSARYGIPDSAVMVQTAGQELHGTLINVSLTGLLCRLPLPERPLGMRGQDVRFAQRDAMGAHGVPVITLAPVVYMDNLLRGWAYPEIAERERVPLGTIKSRINQAAAKLRAALGGAGSRS